jgi:hypothetical protein
MLSIISVSDGHSVSADGVGGIGYEIFSGDILCTNSAGPLTIHYTYAPPGAYLPSYFIDYLIHAIVEEMSAVFGYNMDGQKEGCMENMANWDMP